MYDLNANALWAKRRGELWFSCLHKTVTFYRQKYNIIHGTETFAYFNTWYNNSMYLKGKDSFQYDIRNEVQCFSRFVGDLIYHVKKVHEGFHFIKTIIPQQNILWWKVEGNQAKRRNLVTIADSTCSETLILIINIFFL